MKRSEIPSEVIEAWKTLASYYKVPEKTIENACESAVDLCQKNSEKAIDKGRPRELPYTDEDVRYISFFPEFDSFDENGNNIETRTFREKKSEALDKIVNDILARNYLTHDQKENLDELVRTLRKSLSNAANYLPKKKRPFDPDDAL